MYFAIGKMNWYRIKEASLPEWLSWPKPYTMVEWSYFFEDFSRFNVGLSYFCTNIFSNTNYLQMCIDKIHIFSFLS